MRENGDLRKPSLASLGTPECAPQSFPTAARAGGRERRGLPGVLRPHGRGRQWVAGHERVHPQLGHAAAGRSFDRDSMTCLRKVNEIDVIYCLETYSRVA